MAILKAWRVANVVLANLEMLLNDHGVDAYAETYRNGRENGFVLRLTASCIKGFKSHPHKVAYFSNIRNADGILVHIRCDGNTDMVIDGTSKDAKSFGEKEAYQAAKFIFDELTGVQETIR